MMNFTFQEATREKIWGRIAIKGVAGSGKTYTGLALATFILGENDPGMTKRIAVIDTERGSSRRYAKGRPFYFSVLELKTFEPETYVAAIKAAAEAGFEALVIDSLSHEWAGTGGALEQVEKAGRGGNKFSAWGSVTQRHNAVLDAIMSTPMHVIATMRTKMTYEQVEDETTKKKSVKKLGLQPVQRDGIEYEFDVLGDMDVDNSILIEKSRCHTIAGTLYRHPGKELGREIRAWLEDCDAPAKAEPRRPDTSRPVEPSATKPEPVATSEPAAAEEPTASPLSTEIASGLDKVFAAPPGDRVAKYAELRTALAAWCEVNGVDIAKAEEELVAARVARQEARKASAGRAA